MRLNELIDLLKKENYVVLMRGLPGSGKSTAAKEIWKATFIRSWLVSADDYFTDPATGVYTWRPGGENHRYCLRAFTGLLRDVGPQVVIVDNTNTTKDEMLPYVRIGEAYGYKPLVVNLEVDTETSVKRNVHNVPVATIERMAHRLKTEHLPKEWRQVALET